MTTPTTPTTPTIVTGAGALPQGFQLVYLDPAAADQTVGVAVVDLAAIVGDGPDHHAAAVETGTETSISLWSEHVTGDGRADALLLLADPTGTLTGPGGFLALHALVEDASHVLGIDSADVAVCRVGATSSVHSLSFPGWSVAALRSTVEGGGQAATVLLSDAVVDPVDLRGVLAGVLSAADKDRVADDGAWILMTSGASGVRPATTELVTGLGSVLSTQEVR